MSGFTVDPQALRSCSVEMLAAAGQAGAARDYAKRWTQLDIMQQGAMAKLMHDHDALSTAVIGTLGRVADLLDETSQNLLRAATYYQGADTAGAAALDATFPAVPRTGRTPQMDEGGED